MNAPVYYIHVVCNTCNVDVKVNDCPVHREVKELPNDITLSVSKAVVSGINYLTARVKAKGDGDIDRIAKASVRLFVRDMHEPGEELELARWEMDDLSQREEATTEESGSAVFETELPFNDPLWANTEIIDITEPVIVENLLEYYRKVYSFFANREVESILNAFHLRAREYSRVHHVELEDYMNELRSDLQTTPFDSNFELLPLDPEYLIPKVYGNGRLFTLEDHEGYQALMYMNWNIPSFVTYPIYLSIRPNQSIVVSY